MKTMLLAIFISLLVTVTVTTVFAENETRGNGGENSPAAVSVTSVQGNNTEPVLVTAQNQTRERENETNTKGTANRVRTEKTLSDGTKMITVTSAGKYNLNKTIVTDQGNYRHMEIITPKGSIVIESEGRGAADVTRNSVFLEQIDNEFEEYADIEEIAIDPEQGTIKLRVTNENGTEGETEIPETIQAKIRAHVENQEINITMVKEMKQIRMVSAEENITLAARVRAEVQNGTVYIATEKTRKMLNILPETASETARIHANYHTVKTVEIKELGEDIVYSIQGMQKGKILGLIDTELDIETEVDPETGEVVKSNKPWWSFLVF